VGLSSVAQPFDVVASACLDRLHALLVPPALRPGAGMPEPAPVLLAPRLVLRPSS
jgi:hypothetical protein